MTWPSKKEQVGKMQEPVLGQRFEEDQLIGVQPASPDVWFTHANPPRVADWLGEIRRPCSHVSPIKENGQSGGLHCISYWGAGDVWDAVLKNRTERGPRWNGNKDAFPKLPLGTVHNKRREGKARYSAVTSQRGATHPRWTLGSHFLF